MYFNKYPEMKIDGSDVYSTFKCIPALPEDGGFAMGGANYKEISWDIPGRDGKLRANDAYGAVRFNDRPLSIILILYPGSNLANSQTALENAINGKRVKIWTELYPNNHFYGIGNVTGWYMELGTPHFTIEMEVEKEIYQGA